MQQVIVRLMAASLAFAIGIACWGSLRAGVAQYQAAVLRARETVLRNDLSRMRKAIGKYALEKGKWPYSLNDLVIAGYLREIPEDPFTGRKNWKMVKVVFSSEAENPDALFISNVCSSSWCISTKGTEYNEW